MYASSSIAFLNVNHEGFSSYSSYGCLNYKTIISTHHVILSDHHQTSISISLPTSEYLSYLLRTQLPPNQLQCHTYPNELSACRTRPLKPTLHIKGFNLNLVLLWLLYQANRYTVNSRLIHLQSCHDPNKPIHTTIAITATRVRSYLPTTRAALIVLTPYKAVGSAPSRNGDLRSWCLGMA